MIEFMRELRGRGYKMAICTNNIREWEDALAGDAPRRRDLRRRRRLGVRREPEARAADLRDHARAAGRLARGGAVHRRRRGQLRGRAQARDRGDPVPVDRAGDRGDRGGAAAEIEAARDEARVRRGDHRDRAQRVRDARCRRTGRRVESPRHRAVRLLARGGARIRAGRADRARALPRPASGRAASRGRIGGGRRRGRAARDAPDRRGGPPRRQRASGRGVDHRRPGGRRAAVPRLDPRRVRAHAAAARARGAAARARRPGSARSSMRSPRR